MHLTFFILALSSLLVGTGAEGYANVEREITCSTSRSSYPECKDITVGPGTVCWHYKTSSARLRQYLVSFPKLWNAKSQSPVIFSFHGREKFAIDQLGLSEFSDPNVNNNSIAVYPQGCAITNKEGKLIPQWQGDPEATTNDIQFTLDIIDDLGSKYKIDSSHIYATGKSNGGGFMNLLACDATASTKIAAFAAASGAFYEDGTTNKDGTHPPLVLPPCAPSNTNKPIRFMEFHGLADTIINYNGGWDKSYRGQTLPVLNVVGFWGNQPGCTPKPNVANLCNGSNITTFSWDCPNTENAVVHYQIPYLHHTWPSLTPNGDCSQDNCSIGKCALTCIDASKIMKNWFFTGTLLPQPTNTASCGNPAEMEL